MESNKEYDELTIIAGKFSEAGNYLGICAEKDAYHPPLHIYKKQLETKGWEHQIKLPFFAIGSWVEIKNKPGELRFTAKAIFTNKEEYELAVKNEYE